MKTKVLEVVLTVVITTALIALIVAATYLIPPIAVQYGLMALFTGITTMLVYEIVKDTLTSDKSFSTYKPTKSASNEPDWSTIVNAFDPIENKPKKRGRKPKTATTTTTKKKGK